MNYVVNVVVMICSGVLLCLRPINIVSKPFWVIGESKMGFLDDIGLENRRLEFCPDEHSLKRNTLRSSEQLFATTSLQF